MLESYQIGCPYCDGFLSPHSLKADEIWNTPIIETDNLMVVPTIGMMVPGWLLIVTKCHIKNYSDVFHSLNTEIETLKATLMELLGPHFPKPIFFEHGSSGSVNKSSGSCVDHAHIHVIPSMKNLSEIILGSFSFDNISSLGAVNSIIPEGVGYLYFEDIDGQAYAATDVEVPSQFIRRAVGKAVGRPFEWDWAVYPEVENIQITLNELKL